jgi:hypothetical protein
MGARSQVMQLRQVLATSAEPLRQDQIKPLVQAIAREQQTQTNAPMRAYRQGPMNAETQLRAQEEWLQQQTEAQQRIRNSVASLLTPAQMQQLEAQHERERRMQEMQLRLQRARIAEAQARGEDLSAPNATAVMGSQVGFITAP